MRVCRHVPGERETELEFIEYLLGTRLWTGSSGPTCEEDSSEKSRAVKGWSTSQRGSGNTEAEEALAQDPTQLVQKERQGHFCAQRRHRVSSHRKETCCKASWFLPPPWYQFRVWTHWLQSWIKMRWLYLLKNRQKALDRTVSVPRLQLPGWGGTVQRHPWNSAPTQVLGVDSPKAPPRDLRPRKPGGWSNIALNFSGAKRNNFFEVPWTFNFF